MAQTGKLPADPFGKYTIDIGEAFRSWPKPKSVSTRGNTCTTCHRIGSLETCKRTARESADVAPSPGRDDWARGYPHSHWMPPGNPRTKAQWEVIYRRSLEALLACCADPGKPGCRVVPID